jgi:hypothetical protein
MKRTKWFSVDIKPVRRGWYEVNYDHAMRYWNGHEWQFQLMNGQLRRAQTMMGIGVLLGAKWRGLTKPSKGKK